MKTFWKPVLVVLLVLGGLAWFAVDLMKERAAMTASATATIMRVEFDPDEESRSLDETDFEYEFESNGQRVRASSSLPGDRVKDYPVGRTVSVCYQPGAPSKSRIDTDGGACGG